MNNNTKKPFESNSLFQGGNIGSNCKMFEGAHLSQIHCLNFKGGAFDIQKA